MSTGTIYSQADYARIDIGLQMRFGHPYIAEGDDVIVDICRRLAERTPRPLRIFEVGSGSGYLVELLHRAIPGAELVANEIEPALVELARARFHRTPVIVFGEPFERWTEPVDVLISWGAYHHMMASPGHLAHVGRLLGATGTLVLGDEFSPDYLDDADRARVAAAEVVHLAAGHVLLTHDDKARFEADGTIPDWSRELERRRRRALWTWYKHVIDVALDRQDDVVVDAELHIASNDIRTDFAHEHKLCLPLVLRDLELNGFVERARTALEERPELASFFILELGYRPSAGERKNREGS
jgi:SAM-dependent methyltransferase